MKIELTQSRNIYDYKPLLKLYDVFGSTFINTMLLWCDVVEHPFSQNEFWEVYIVKQNDKTIGVCGLYNIDGNKDEVWLGWFGILPEYRNGGIGVEVLTNLKELAKSNGFKTILSYVDSNRKAIPFYLRNGFEEINTVEEYALTHELEMDNFEALNDYVIKCKL